jgi:hypothetical protein
MAGSRSGLKKENSELGKILAIRPLEFRGLIRIYPASATPNT